MHDPQKMIDAVNRWVERIVVGLNLCPFAAGPLGSGKVRTTCSRAEELGELLAEVLHEADLLQAEDAEAETTLLIAPILNDFDDFLDAIAAVEALLTQHDLDGVLQLAHFHPDYRFEGTQPGDPAQLTNRSPHPILHLLRWSDVRHAVESHPDVARIPTDNQSRLQAMGTRAVHALDLPLALSRFKCWDTKTQAIFESKGEALEDCILQTRAELESFAQFIEDHQVQSYLEIGIWTGKLVCALQHVFCFEKVAACDQGWAEQCGFEIKLPPEVQFFHGNSSGPEFLKWREALGHIDLVMIDGDHSYAGVKRDFEIQKDFPHRFLAFHDITGANRWTRGVKRFWSELNGEKTEFIHPHIEADLDTPSMGIGIWSKTERLS